MASKKGFTFTYQQSVFLNTQLTDLRNHVAWLTLESGTHRERNEKLRELAHMIDRLRAVIEENENIAESIPF